MKTKVALFISAIMVLVLLVGGNAIMASGANTGALWTTDDNGAVDSNIYDSKEDVFLNGGPISSSSIGFEDGEYYWKVTTPSGAYLGGSGDQTFTVVDGSFAAAFNLWDYNPPESHYADSPNGEYKVWVSKNSEFPNNESKTDNFRVRISDTTEEPTFGSITATKFYDTDTDGTQDAGEPGIAGWKVDLYSDDGTLIKEATTAEDGTITFANLDPGAYSVTEVMPGGAWINTTPLTQNATVESGDTSSVSFGNVLLGAGGGHTLGFWSNKNGQSIMNDGGSLNPELAMLSALNLRNGLGADFDPTGYTQFRSWLLNSYATNMAYMLSVQLAATELNVEASATNNGFVNGSALVYAAGSNSANSAGFATVSDLMGEANEELGLHGTAYDADAWRSYQEALKNAFDSANNNLNFVQPPVTSVDPY